MLKKKIIFYITLILLFILLIILSIITIQNIETKFSSSNCMENTYEFDGTSPFSITKIVYFSSANCDATINTNSSFTISNLYQYTDIAIFIDNNTNSDSTDTTDNVNNSNNTDSNNVSNNSENFTAENTLKAVTLSNITFSLTPSVGTPSLYYKNINDFTKSSFDTNYQIGDTLEFEISSEDEVDYSSPILYNNCANPITLCYVNSDLKTDYTLIDTISNISYDGSLLKTCNITLNSISCKLSFLITITSNSNDTYTCPVILTIPLSTESSTLYDGSLILNDATNYNFIKSSN